MKAKSGSSANGRRIAAFLSAAGSARSGGGVFASAAATLPSRGAVRGGRPRAARPPATEANVEPRA